jgi:hypothetical protein
MKHLNFKRADLVDYYYDAQIQRVVSTKQGKPVPLTWQTAPSRPRRVPSKRGTEFVALKPRGFYTETFRVFRGDLADMLVSETAQVPTVESKGLTIEKDRYIVGTATAEGGVSLAKIPKVHDTEVKAKKEAERLAIQLAPKTVVVLKIVGTVKASGIQWG